MKSEKTVFFKWDLLTISIFIICLLLPFYSSTIYSSPTITSKFLFFSYSLFFVLGVFLLFVLFHSKIAVSTSKIDLSLLFLVIYILFNSYYFQEYSSFSVRFLELLGLSFLYLILRNIPIQKYYWVFIAILFSGIGQVIYGNLQLLGYYPSKHSGFKMTGSFFNPGPYAGFLVAVWGVALGMYLFKETIQKHFLLPYTKKTFFLKQLLKNVLEYLPLLVVVGILMVLPASQSRAAWLALVFNTAVLLELRYKYISAYLIKTNRLQTTAITMVSVLLLSSALFGVYHFKKGSSDGRLFIWKVSSEIIKSNPVNGVGIDRFKAHYMNYQAAYFKEHGATEEIFVADNSKYAFNEGIQFLVANGMLGFCILLLVLYVVFSSKSSEEHIIFRWVSKVGLLGITVFALFSYPLQILPIKLIVVVLLSYLASTDILKYKRAIFYKRQFFSVFKVIFVILGLWGGLIGFQYLRKLDAGFQNWKIATDYYQYGDYESVIESYEEVYPLFKKNGAFLMNYGKTLSMNNQHVKAVVILKEANHYLSNTIIQTALGDSQKALKNYKEAEVAYQKAADMIPSRFYPEYLLAKLYRESGQLEKAKRKARMLLQKKIKIPSTAIREMQMEMKKILENSKITSEFR